MAERLPKSFLLPLVLGMAVASCGAQLPIEGVEGATGQGTEEEDAIVDGSITIENGARTAKSLVVKLSLTATSDTTLMQISESSIFENESWEHFKSSTEYTFDSQGPKKLYAKFANRYGLQSSPFSATITIDLAPTADDLFTSRVLKSDGFNLENQYRDYQTIATIGSKIYAWGIQTADGKCSSLSSSVLVDAGCAIGGAYYDTATEDGWIPIANAPTSTRGFSSIAAVGNKIIAWGGMKGWSGSNYPAWNQGLPASAHYLGLQIYNSSTNSWSTSTASGALSPRAGSVVVSTGSTVIIWGGFDRGFTSLLDAAEYNPSTDTWTAIPFGPFSSRDVSVMWKDQAVWTGTELYIFSYHAQCSGTCIKTETAEIVVYNKASNQWRKLTSKIVVTRAVYHDGYIYFPEEKKRLNTADETISDWTPIAPTQQTPYNVYTSINGLLYSHSSFTLMPFNASTPE